MILVYMFHKNSSYFKCSRQPSNCWRSSNHEKKKEEGAADAETVCIGLARVGADTQRIVSGTLTELSQIDLGEPLHCLIVTGKLHPMEIEFLEKLKTVKVNE